ncbi:MAG: hypothetical protein Q8L57_00595, partial [bacterium]|nr:hypothetical protein [bacterium]
ISVFYFFSPRISENLFISKSLFGAALIPVEKIIRTQAPEFSKDMTIDDAILLIAAGGVFDQAVKSRPELQKLSPRELEKAREQFFNEIKKEVPKQRQELSKQFGVALKGDETVAETVYNLFLVKFRELPKEVRLLFNFFLVLTLYFTLKIAAIPFGWLAQIAAAGLLRLMLILKFVSIKKETIEREIVSL